MSNLLLRRRHLLSAQQQIDWDSLAIQTLDSTKPNYNPAAAIILNANNKGTVAPNGRWYLTKEQAANVTSFGTIFKGKQNVADSNGIVSSDTSATYRFTSFDEIVHFFNVHTLVSNAFANSSIVNITLPANITNYGGDTFQGCQFIESVYAMANIEYTTRTLFDSSWALSNVVRGTIYFNGNYTATLPFKNRAKNFLIKGNLVHTSSYNLTMFSYGAYNGDSYFWQKLEVFRVGGNLTGWASTQSVLGQNYYLKFAEYMGTIVNSAKNCVPSNSTNTIVHLGYDGIAGSYSHFDNNKSHASKIYVGSGISRANDQNVLSLYLADSNWNTNLSSKLDIWYNYNGEYKWYYVTNNLTNFTNSNPVEWPYITRGESYNTTIVPTGDAPLNRVMVLMYEAVDDGTTPDNPTDITSQVYNANTGEINIPHVTGNVIIEETFYDAEIEYLECTGTQYIDTGIIPDATTTVQFKFKNLNVTGNVIIGYRSYADKDAWRFFNYNSKAYFDVPSDSLNRIYGGTINPNVVYELELGNHYVKDLSTETYIVTGTEYSKAGIDSIKFSNGSQNAFYYVKIFKNNNLVIDLIPVRIGTTGYMYDKVSRQLFGNSGTGNFILGPDKN